MTEKGGENRETKGMGWRVSLSIIVGVGWLVFLILWLFFYASAYSGYQNIAIFLLSILLVVCILGAPWTIWGLKHQTEKEKDMWRTKGFKWRVWVSAFLVFILAIFLIYWFWFHAETYSLYQNAAIFIVSILIIGGVLGASWAPWGMKHGNKFEDRSLQKEKKALEKTEKEDEKETDSK